ncbi:MAG: HEAT repeat domain-containing protein [Microcoleaceae cyanobacterium]
MSASNSSTGNDSTLSLQQQETDALLQRVRQQQTNQTFDDTDQMTLKQLVESFSDSRGMTRLALAETLGEIGKPATPVLVEGLAKHPNPVVRRACAKTLTLIEDPDAIPTLVDSLSDEDTVIQASASGALARLGEAAVPPLLKVLEDPNHSESIKGYVSWALAFMGPQVADSLCQAFDSKSEDVRAAVVAAIANIAQNQPDEKFLNLLTQALSDPVEAVRTEAVSAFGRLTYQPAIPALVKLLKSDSGESRKAATVALMKMDDSTALEPLKTALSQESDPGIRQAMELAISQLKK